MTTHLRGVASRINDAAIGADIKSVIETLALASREMERNSYELENKLAKSENQINSLNERLEEMRTESRTDALTGIGNRKCFDETLAHETATVDETQEKLCLCIVTSFERHPWTSDRRPAAGNPGHAHGLPLPLAGWRWWSISARSSTGCEPRGTVKRETKGPVDLCQGRVPVSPRDSVSGPQQTLTGHPVTTNACVFSLPSGGVLDRPLRSSRRKALKPEDDSGKGMQANPRRRPFRPGVSPFRRAGALPCTTGVVNHGARHSARHARCFLAIVRTAASANKPGRRGFSPRAGHPSLSAPEAK